MKTHICTLSFLTNLHTCTHTHRLAGLPVLPNRNTQGAVCWMVGLGLGRREAWLSTPVFAAVIRGAFYFEGGERPCAHTHCGADRESSQRRRRTVHVGWCLLCSNLCFLWLKVWTPVESSKWPVNTNSHISSSRPFKSSSWSAHARLNDMTDSRLRGYYHS